MNLKITRTFFVFACIVMISEWGLSQNGETEITGTVVETGSKQPVAFATVLIGEKTTQKGITGTTTLDDGSFSIKTDAQDFFVEISFIGFEKKRFDNLVPANGKIELGVVQLNQDAQQLSEVVVEGEVSRTQFKLDKRVFNVGKDISSTGASALEVLNNVPSVNVNIEGQISLRGSQGVQVLINGKPSILTGEGGNALGTITSDMIERVEVITNPSAKYDAEGTSGIINIVIKKEEREGLNGSISLNTGSPDNHSFGLSLNRRTERFNLFSQLGAGYRELPNDVENINRNLVDGTAISSVGEEFRNEEFYNVILGTDYYINENNVVTLSGNFAYEIEDQPSNTNFKSSDAGNQLVSEWERTETTEATNPKYQYELQYKSDFKDHEDHDLLFSALGNFFGKDQSSDFEDVTISGEDNDALQRTRTEFKEAEYTFKLDYTRPFNEEWTMEAGGQYVMNDVSNDYEVDDFVNGDYQSNPDLTNVFEYDQKVLAAYGTAAYEGGKWGVKAGVRAEQTNLNTLLKNTNERNEQNYTNLFPSAHTSYKFNDKISMQAGYSRRVYRPGLWDLNPFFNIRNNFNIRQGNPDLQPEFTDSYEVTSIYVLGKASLNFSIYHRYTTEVIESIFTFEDDVKISKPENIGTNKATGLEFNGKYSPAKWFTVTTDLNYNKFVRDGSLGTQVFDFDADRWSAKLMTKIKLPADIDFETTGNYQSSYETVQGKTSENVFLDLGARKKILKGKGVVNLGIRDLFASRIEESETFQETFSSYNRRQRGRFITFGFSYGFGKGEAMEYSGRRR
ncbi:outer membrane beta-barrel family protein [Zobellia sp. 1_MG-2023]|uniref:outer membrane beta-barrel family protein n=1 Tax=Zobellia sp. 1_MG-2023 TaxID=3062626 RepID=UPI0026E3F32F|nr:outer membrane beta-barrel family protein [Zobellia sp. 1_MG-2023]MDO6819980.1 outer membrane beta-barrel family protein [Zobellia sp. 1_MG-2023]